MRPIANRGQSWRQAARRPFFALADLAETARHRSQGKMPVPISPLALEMVRRTMRCLRSSVRSTALAAISAVFTIGYVAKLFGEDEDWLHELSISMFPEDGWLHVYGVGDDGVTAFTQYGIECLKQIVADERAAGRAPKPSPSTQ